MKLEEINGRLNQFSDKDQESILSEFVNSIILDLNVTLSRDEINHIKSRIFDKKGKSITMMTLREIRFEIISNYKKYLPFCYASIETAAKNKEL